MAGTHSYLYVDDMTITAEQNVPGNMIQVFVKASFDARVSAFDVNIEFPESVTLFSNGYLRKGDDLTISWTDFFGDTQSAEAGLQGNANHAIAAFTAAGYENGALESYGVAKWEAGEYDNMYSFYFLVPEGGLESFTFTTSSAVSAGHDSRGGVVDETQASERIDHTTTVTVEQAQEPAPEPTITMDENYQVSAVVYDEEGNVVERDVKLYTVEIDEEGNEVEGTRQEVTNPYNVTQTYQEQKISFVAVTPKVDGESEDTECEPKTFTIPAKDKETVAAPTVVGQTDADSPWLYNIVITPNGDGDLNYTITPSSVTPKETITDPETGVVTLVFEKGENPVTVQVVAYTEEGATCAESDPTTENIVVPKLDQVATPEINYTVDGNKIIITAECATDGATIVLYDPEGNAVDNPAEVTFDPYEGYSKTWTAKATKEHMLASETGSKLVTVEAINKKDAAAPTIVGQKREGSKKLFDIIITPDPNTEGKLVYTADPMGEVVRAGATTIQYERGETDYYVDVTAYTEEGATYKESPLAEATIKVPKLDQVEEPVINYVVDGDKITVTATCDTEGSTVVLVGPDDTEYPSGTATVTFDPYQGYDETWTATASADDMLDNSATKEIKIDAKKVYKVADPTISVDNSDPTKTVITIEATEGDLTYNIDAEEGVVYTVEEVDGKVIITVVNGDETAFVNVTATTTLTSVPEGYDEVKKGEAEKNVEIPAKPEQTAAPTIDVSFGGETGSHYANVTFVNNDNKPAVIEYSLDNGETWNTYTPGVPVVVTTYGETTVLARAKAEGKTMSDTAERSFTLNDDATSVNELTNGKAVAGVRYFNMAGQEMQEANGITIVVTTYTDGTTTAVKVIK